jgi:hypothetical protein
LDKGVGHFAPLLEPEPVANELIAFFESAPYLTHIGSGSPSATTTHAAANFPQAGSTDEVGGLSVS